MFRASPFTLTRARSVVTTILVDFARRHEIVVTAIVLIPSIQDAPTRGRRSFIPKQTAAFMRCPTCRPTEVPESTRFVLDKIAERYRNTDREPGGITNWIAHNEVDFHPVWTNMGDQPREVFTETYYRSMRMIHNAARRHNPHARVFASLTHHWVVPDDGKWRQLAPKEVLQTLQRYSEQEGDFAWGVAYHPYPQNLFAPVAWNDTNVRDDSQTPLITIQNLEVLGRFLQQAEMRDASGQRGRSCSASKAFTPTRTTKRPRIARPRRCGTRCERSERCHGSNPSTTTAGSITPTKAA